ncbi:putative ESAT-6-like protein 10 [Mycobacterium marinum]|nr:EsxJ [Mycobacterium marinum]RFZ48476.1 putative ESAT-6-like protein 10 [Mycobacterium marinum]
MTTRPVMEQGPMRDAAGRFDAHAQTVADQVRRMWGSSQNVSGAG